MRGRTDTNSHGAGGRGGGKCAAAGAVPSFAQGRHLHRAVAVGNPTGAAQPSRQPTKRVGASAGSQAVDAHVAKAVGPERCTRCAACEAACPQGAISVDRIATVDESQCTGCGDCVDVCAFDVLALQPR